MRNDPICGMKIDTNTAKHKTKHLEASYYFCCAMCKDLFETNPSKYLTI